MTRVVPGWEWLHDGGRLQGLNWQQLRADFARYVLLNGWLLANLREWKEVDEKHGEIILRIEAEVVHE